METQMEAQTKVPAAERPKKRPSRRIAAQLNISRSAYRRMRQRAAGERLSFGQWLERAALKELRRKSTL
jgi:hypothetical protein